VEQNRGPPLVSNLMLDVLDKARGLMAGIEQFLAKSLNLDTAKSAVVPPQVRKIPGF
jgi:hypothetical protein